MLTNIVDPQNLSSNNTTNANWCEPHDASYHLHNDLEDCLEEVNNHTALGTDGAKAAAENQTKEDETECVGAWSENEFDALLEFESK